MGLLQSTGSPPDEAILTALLNEIKDIPDDFVLVLDDYHAIDAVRAKLAQPVDVSTDVDDVLTFLLEHLPPHMQLAITLYGSVDPRRRERWIEDHGYVDTLITNPRLVQTGLDLVSFQTVVFYEPEYSLYTLWQALRRVWRLGQTQPVKAVFAVYKDAMEAQALALMGRKMRAAQTSVRR